MKKGIISLLVLVSTLALVQCDYFGDKAEVVENDKDWFVFGKYYCECGGNCATVYRIENEQLFKRTETNKCSMDELTTEAPALDQSKYELALALLNDFPEQMWTDAKETYGCPDCGDWGGYRIVYYKDGVTRTWQIDTKTDNLPDWLLPYQDKIKNVLDGL